MVSNVLKECTAFVLEGEADLCVDCVNLDDEDGMFF
jgi:hypothetical protein